MFCLFKKTFGVCLIGLGLRNITGIITSTYWMAFCHWYSNMFNWFNLAGKLITVICK